MSFDSICSVLKELQGKTLILTHHNADVDAIASAIALHLGLSQLKIDSTVAVSESVSRPAQNIAKNAKILINPDCNDFQNIILVDTSVPEQLSKVKNLKADYIIDHHPKGKLIKQAKESYIDEQAKSASQIVFKILIQLGCQIDKKLAQIILAGIIADSAHFRLADEKAMEVVLETLKAGAEIGETMESIHFQQDASATIASLKAAKRMDVYKIGDLILVFSHVVSHEAAACRNILKLGADIAIVIAKKQKAVRISSRAKNTILQHNLDLSEIFKEVGNIISGSGGGHDMAGSANGKNKKAANSAVKYIKKQIEKKIGKQAKKID